MFRESMGERGARQSRPYDSVGWMADEGFQIECLMAGMIQMVSPARCVKEIGFESARARAIAIGAQEKQAAPPQSGLGLRDDLGNQPGLIVRGRLARVLSVPRLFGTAPLGYGTAGGCHELGRQCIGLVQQCEQSLSFDLECLQIMDRVDHENGHPQCAEPRPQYRRVERSDHDPFGPAPDNIL
jgi:hypothetical protein